MIRLPDRLPLVMQDITIMRCVTCGAILPGRWGATRQGNRPGVDHYLDHHADAVITGRMPSPPIINCAIQDPFWFDEHTRGGA